MGKAGLEARVLLFRESASWHLSLRESSSVMRLLCQTADLCSQPHSAPWEATLQEALELGLSAGTADQLSLLVCVHLGSRVMQGKRAKALTCLVSLLSLW